MKRRVLCVLIYGLPKRIERFLQNLLIKITFLLWIDWQVS